MTRVPLLDDFIRVAAPKGILLDSGVALLFYLGSFDQALIGQVRRTEVFVVEDFVTLRRIVAFFSRMVTTPHVLTEVCNLLGHFGEPKRTQFFQTLETQLAGVNEHHLPAVGLSAEPVFPRLELTDTAILSLARSGLGVVTIDRTLHEELLREGSASINFNHVRTLFWR